MSNANFVSASANAVIISQLSLERCQGYLSHLHALMHLYNPEEADGLVAESARKIIQSMEGELEHSVTLLSTFE